MVATPRRLEFLWRVMSSNTQWVAIRPIDPTEQFEAGRVGPMRILEDHQHGTFAGKRLDLSKSAFAQRSYECIYVSFDTPRGGT